jgi:hypothetical protein
VTRLSPQGLTVLEALAQPPSGRLTIRRLVTLLQPAHSTPASTRASLSRTLRRLWRAGLVELEHDGGLTLTEMQTATDAELACFDADPAGDYAAVLAKIAAGRIPACFARKSQAAYLAYRRQQIADRTRHARTRAAVLTAAGRERASIDTSFTAEWLTSSEREVNRSEDVP